MLKDHTLDTILMLQCVVAWAGEAMSDPPRLSWWQTDMFDEYGGGFWFSRLLPRTWRWGSLEAARAAAMDEDAQRRKASLGDPDAVRTLFFWGFDIDEALSKRWAEHKASASDPRAALGFPDGLGPFLEDAAFDVAALERLLERGEKLRHEVEPGGRRLIGAGEDPAEVVWALARGLTPLGDRYPMPFVPRDVA